MARKCITFLRPNFCLIFQKIQLTSPVTVFFRYKNASKSDENYAFWVALRTIHIPRSGIQTGAQNHAKWRQNASQISAKWSWKNIDSDVAMLKSVRRRPSCETAWKRVHFCRSRVALLKKRISRSSKVIENLSQMPAARRANSKCIFHNLNIIFFFLLLLLSSSVECVLILTLINWFW